MNRDGIIRMAREAGGGLSSIAEPLEHPWKFSESELIRFVALVASAERERISKKIEQLPFGDTSASFSIFVREDA